MFVGPTDILLIFAPSTNARLDLRLLTAEAFGAAADGLSSEAQEGNSYTSWAATWLRSPKFIENGELWKQPGLR
jgi:hypothetical protein